MKFTESELSDLVEFLNRTGNLPTAIADLTVKLREHFSQDNSTVSDEVVSEEAAPVVEETPAPEEVPAESAPVSPKKK